MNILLNETSLSNESNTEITITIINVISVRFQHFQYFFILDIQKTNIINRKIHHNHSRNNAGKDEEHNWIQYTKNVAIT